MMSFCENRRAGLVNVNGFMYLAVKKGIALYHVSTSGELGYLWPMMDFKTVLDYRVPAKPALDLDPLTTQIAIIPERGTWRIFWNDSPNQPWPIMRPEPFEALPENGEDIRKLPFLSEK